MPAIKQRYITLIFSIADFFQHSKIKSKLSVQILRHTFIIRRNKANIPANAVQKWAGHASVKMTLKTYTHVNKEFEEKNTKQFDTYSDTYSDTHKN